MSMTMRQQINAAHDHSDHDNHIYTCYKDDTGSKNIRCGDMFKGISYEKKITTIVCCHYRALPQCEKVATFFRRTESLLRPTLVRV